MRSTVVLATALMLTGGLALGGTASAQEREELADAQRELEIAREQL